MKVLSRVAFAMAAIGASHLEKRGGTAWYYATAFS
jgi:hypothetical protein